jgi:ribosomal protein S18 acetylase RimI-like enzyme
LKNDTLRIRNAGPQDASFLAKSILIAGRAHVTRGIWEVILEGAEDDALRFLQSLSVTRIPHLFHYSCYLIAEEKTSGPVGSLGGYDPNIAGYHALQQAIPEVVRKANLPAQVSNISERARRILACLPKGIEGAWVIDSVATLPEHRRKGVSEKLLRAILEKGKRRGHSKAQVNMYIGNEPALKLYRKLGFEIVEETLDEYFEKSTGSPGMLSLVKDLQ